MILPFLLGNCPTEVAPIGVPDDSTGESPTTAELPTTGETPPPDPSDSTSTDAASSTSTSDTTAAESTSTGAPEPACGDGVLDEGEACDDGFADNTIDGACLPDCTLASCGDGFVQAGVEECDKGDANNFLYAGCNKLTCKWGPRCGDGQVDVPEEVCDPGDPSNRDDELVGCDPDCRLYGRIVFLSSDEYEGNLDGLDGADLKCRTLAAKFDKARADTYRAWLSDYVQGPAHRFAHGMEFATVPYVLRSGLPIAADFDALTTGWPWPGITLTEDDQDIADQRVWSYTGGDGLPLMSGNNCDGWTTNESGEGEVGTNWLANTDDLDAWAADDQWTTHGLEGCKYPHRIYCFEN